MSDLTVIFYTANVLHEPFAGTVRQQLVTAIAGRYPLISVSQRPMEFGQNICVGDIGRSHLNLYRQILIGCRAATTKYVAMAEDDILYSPDHFQAHRPSPGTFAYDMAKWSLFTWTDPPIFSFRNNRKVVNSLIAERDMLIDALKERFDKFAEVPDEEIPIKHWGDPGRYENLLGVTVRPTEEFYTTYPNIVFSHEEAFGFQRQGRRKKHGDMRAIEIPLWGRAEELVRLYYEK